MIPVSYYLILSSLLFGIGLVGLVIHRKNLVTFLVCIELLLLAVNTNFLALSSHFNNLSGQIAVFFVLTVAAAEAAVSLSILITLFRQRHTIEPEKLDTLRG